MDDLVKRLRHIRRDGCYCADAPKKPAKLHPVCTEAADAIEQLQRQLAEAGNQLGWAARRLPPSHREVVEKWAADAEAANNRERTD